MTNSLNRAWVDSDRLRSLLDGFLEADKAYREVIYRNDHTEKEADRAQYVVFRTASHVAHMLNEMILRDQIVILDVPAYAYKTDDVDPEYGASLVERRRKVEEAQKNAAPQAKRLPTGTYVPGRDGKYHLSDDNGGTLCGEAMANDAKHPYELCPRCESIS